jgi:hypothetical protein
VKKFITEDKEIIMSKNAIQQDAVAGASPYTGSLAGRPRKLNQIIAVRKSQAKDTLSRAYQTLKKEELFNSL